MFTNQGRFIYRPVHELTDARWKDTGEHLSQTIDLDDDEVIVKAMLLDKLDLPGTFIFATSDGQVKQSALSDYQPGSRYKTHASVAIKLREGAQVVSVDYFEPEQAGQSVLAISRRVTPCGLPLKTCRSLGFGPPGFGPLTSRRTTNWWGSPWLATGTT